MLGREKCGVLPIRGHSGVQGGGECGVDPDKYPGGFAVSNEDDRRRFEELWGAPLPAWKGHRTLQMMEAAHRGEIDFLYSIGGNLLETLPDRDYMAESLARVRLRIHQDIVLNTSSVLEGPIVVLLPAQTRYETRGGGTTTSTERRVRFTPEIQGPRIAEARPEWEIPVRVAIAARPALARALAWRGPADLRSEMAEAMPMYAGVEGLEREGQWIQWGGERLFADGFTRMPGGRARFTATPVPRIEIPPGWFYLTTRRGKQFNTMEYGRRDFIAGGVSRRDVLMNMERLGLQGGEEIRLRSEVGSWVGIARAAPMKERYLQAYWPETNALISRRFDPVSGEPDYNALVRVEPAGPPVETVTARVDEAATLAVPEAQPVLAPSSASASAAPR
jgi:predicted molibdopterin-dependent oxidoreductase YjgC